MYSNPRGQILAHSSVAVQVRISMRPDRKTLDSSSHPAAIYLSLPSCPLSFSLLDLPASDLQCGNLHLRSNNASTFLCLSPFIRHLRARASQQALGNCSYRGYSAYETATLELSRGVGRLGQVVRGLPHVLLRLLSHSLSCIELSSAATLQHSQRLHLPVSKTTGTPSPLHSLDFRQRINTCACIVCAE